MKARRLRVLMIAAGIAAAGLVVLWLYNFLKTDACLDRGKRVDPVTGRCEP